jgi:polyhydroxyalkanoic acid synthase PhaR subunit
MSAEQSTQDLFSMWKQSVDQAMDAWRGLSSQPQTPDVFQFWRPLFGQNMDLWTQMLKQGATSPDVLAQWKRFLDDSIEAWSKVLGKAMETEGFAAAMGKFLDQYLNTVGPIRKSLHSSSEDFLRAMNLPSRKQVTDLAAQLVSLETRLEEMEEQGEKVVDKIAPTLPTRKQLSDLAGQVMSLEERLKALDKRIEDLVGSFPLLENLVKKKTPPKPTPSARG